MENIQAMAKDKLSDEEAAKTSLLEAPNKKPRTSKFGYGFGDSFGSSMQPNTSGERAKSLFETGGNGNDDDDGDDDNAGGEEDDDNNDGPQVAFTTYALPENAVVVTGEESEICLMQVRVKLFRLNYKHKESEEDGLKSMLTLGPTSGTKDSDHGRGVPLEQPPSIDTAEEDNGGSKRNQNKEKDNEKEKDNSKVGVDMSSAEWVEVGIGPLKVLQSKQLDESLKDDDSKEDSEKQSAGKKEHFRIVMRREEKKGGLGTKLLLNIRLDQYVTVVPASDKALRILGVTYNEDSTSSLGTFLIKSKTAQVRTPSLLPLLLP